MAVRESTTQPIICCIGTSVAGQPTQFLLERAFHHMNLPWRALSVEFDASKFSQICESMLAMGFQGLRFYGEFERLASQELGKSSPIVRFVGSATSAERSGDQWLIWNNIGQGWLSLLQYHQVSAVWLYGDCVQTRSLMAALLQSSFNWIWSNAPATDCQSAVDDSLKSVIRTRVFDASDSPEAELIENLLGLQADGGELDTHANMASEKHRIAIVSAHETLPDHINTWLTEHNTDLVVSATLGLPEPLVANRIKNVTAVDLAVAAEAFDFKQWTRDSIDSTILRDAYDEFCDL